MAYNDSLQARGVTASHWRRLLGVILYMTNSNLLGLPVMGQAILGMYL